MMNERPSIETLKTGAALRRWYWRKAELADYARSLGLKTSMNKFALLDQIALFLDTGRRDTPTSSKPRTTATFDWHAAPLSKDTVITDNYRNTQNVRRFFKSQLGEAFKFNIAFMDWMKANPGRSLADACEAYRTLKSDPGKTQIRAHNQFNQYTRDYLADNPGHGMNEVRRVWSMKIARPSDTGRHRYDPTDLDLE